MYARRYFVKEEKYTGNGQRFVESLFDGSSVAFREALGVRPAVFSALLVQLETETAFGGTRCICAREHLAIFLWTVRWAATCRLVSITFGHSTVTISRPRNAHALYNKKNASLRSVVERIFGVIQERFKILVAGCDYDLKTQANVFPALAVVHNFIRLHDPDDTNPHPDDDNRGGDIDVADEGDLSRTSCTTSVEKKRGEKEREKVAQSLWMSYRVKKSALGV
ncbi:unnamed protein product [Tilletia caries]|uniref:DDE Tnp4 domain-containing protein n=1 Tax=Tilletia caries TaxID=13290 RepID=A0ABN7IJ23_9BASI|nr:unnamed protein product [Tilletia caries]